MTDRGPSAQEAGITAGGSVRQSAGNDAVGRDKITAFSLVSVYFGERRRAREARLAAEFRPRFTERVALDYRERLDEAFTVVSGQLSLSLVTSAAVSGDPLDRHLLRAGEQSLPADASIADVYAEFCEPTGEHLLVLGDPGCGKTTALFALGAELLAARPADGPIPTYLPLAGYRRRPDRGFGLARRGGVARHPVARWLAGQIERFYRVGARTALEWLASGQLILLLDGLDEIVDPDSRRDCVADLNDFLTTYQLPAVICCRRDEYENLGTPLAVGKAVVIKPFDPETVREFLRAAGEPMAGVRAALDADPGLLELCRSPLLLQIVAVAYRDAPAGDLGAGDDPARRRARIIGDYVDQRFRFYRPVTRGRDEPARARQWLAVLARNLRRRETPVLHLEDLDADWIPSRVLRTVATATPWLGPGLVIGAMVRPIAGVVAFLCAAVAHAAGLQPDEWTFRNVVRNIRQHLIALPIIGLCGGLVFAFTNARVLERMSLWPLDVTVSIPVGCSILGLVGGAVVAPLIAGFGDYFPAARRSPYEVVKRTTRAAAVVAVFSGLVTMVLYLAVFKVAGTEENLIYRGRMLVFPPEMQLYNATVVYGIAIAALYVVIAGWGEVTRLALTRLLLRAGDLAPVRYVTWLEELVRLRLVYRSSGGYVFIHKLVQEQIAAPAVHTGPQAPRP